MPLVFMVAVSGMLAWFTVTLCYLGSFAGNLLTPALPHARPDRPALYSNPVLSGRGCRSAT